MPDETAYTRYAGTNSHQRKESEMLLVTSCRTETGDKRQPDRRATSKLPTIYSRLVL